MDTIPELDSSENTSNDIINISGEATNNNNNNNAATSASPLSSSSRSSSYENQKRRDWNTFGQYLKNHRPPLSLSRCSGAYVLEFLRYLDQFEKTKVHTPICPFYGHPSPLAPCPCPICGLEGDNLIERSTNLDWYKGPTLLEALEQIQEPNRHSNKPLRLPLEGVKIGSNGTVAVGRIETGILKPGMKVTLGPIGLTAKVKSVEMNHHESVQEALPGDTVSIHMKKKKKKKIDVKCGYVASNSKDDPAKEAVSFISQLVILNRPTACLISNGYTAMLHCHTFHGVVKFEEIMSKTDLMKSGDEDDHQEHVEEEPNFLEKGDVGIVKMVPMKPMVVEAFEEYPPLGHFTITDMEKIVGVGVIKSVEKKEYCDGGNKGIKSAVIKTGKRLGAAVGHALFVAILQFVVAALS